MTLAREWAAFKSLLLTHPLFSFGPYFWDVSALEWFWSWGVMSVISPRCVFWLGQSLSCNSHLEFACVNQELEFCGVGLRKGNNRFIFFPICAVSKAVWFEMSAGGCRLLPFQTGEVKIIRFFWKAEGEPARVSTWKADWGQAPGGHSCSAGWHLGNSVCVVNRAREGYCHLLWTKNHREFWEITFNASDIPDGKTENAPSY